MIAILCQYLLICLFQLTRRSLLSPRHISDAFKAVFKKRKDDRRLYLLLLIAIMVSNYVSFFGERNVRYLYVRKRYGWQVTEYSLFNTFQSSLSLICK